MATIVKKIRMYCTFLCIALDNPIQHLTYAKHFVNDISNTRRKKIEYYIVFLVAFNYKCFNCMKRDLNLTFYH